MGWLFGGSGGRGSGGGGGRVDTEGFRHFCGGILVSGALFGVSISIYKLSLIGIWNGGSAG